MTPSSRIPMSSSNSSLNRLFLESLEPRLLLDGQSQAIELFSASPALFVQNRGQWADTAVRYGFEGAGCGIAFRDSGLDFLLYRGQDGGADGAKPMQAAPSSGEDADSTRFSMRFEGANAVTPVGQEQVSTRFNYLSGAQANWRSNVPAFGVVSYPGIYDGIDLRSWGKRTGLKYEFDVAPGADYRQIRVHYSGINGLSISADGALHIQTALGEIVEQAPHIYQQIDGRQVDVAGGFKIIDANTYGFTLSDRQDTSKPLILDPDLTWFTYLGGGGDDNASDIALDAAGNAYITGSTCSFGLATTGAYDTTFGGNANSSDTFVAKFDPSGSSLSYFTYLGGAGDAGTGIAVDTAGNVYVTGITNSSGLATVGAYDTTCNSGNGSSDAFVAKLNATGTKLAYFTYLGGGGDDRGTSITVDSGGNAYVTGDTTSSGLATTGAYDTTFNTGSTADITDAFVAKVNAAGSKLLYFTYLGGTGLDEGYGVAIDPAGNAYVTGETSSSGLATVGAYDTNCGNQDAFVAKLNATGSALSYFTYLGGGQQDSGRSIAVNAAGNAYVTGTTFSSGLATPGAFQTAIHDGHNDAFVAKFNTTGSALAYFTYLGGIDMRANDIALDAAGNVYLTGTPGGLNQATKGAYQTAYGGGDYDAFLAKLNATGSGLAYYTYLGGDKSDEGRGVAVDAAGNAYLTGYTQSRNLATAGAYQVVIGGLGSWDAGDDAFVAGIPAGSMQNSPPVIRTNPDSLTFAQNTGIVPVDAGVTVCDADNKTLTGGKVWISDGYVSGQDVLGFTNQNGITGTWDAATGTMTLTGAATAAQYQAAMRSVTYTITSSAPNVNSRNMSFTVSDGTLDCLAADRLILVNHAPVLDTSIPMAFPDTKQGTSNTGTSVWELVHGAGLPIWDEDYGDWGIAVVGTNSTYGSWQFSLDSGNTWTTFKGYNSAARLLAFDTTTRIRFVPVAGYAGTIASALTFKAWDQTAGDNGGTISALAVGSWNCLSVATESISINVLPPDLPKYSVTDMGDLGSYNESDALAINSLGQVVGSSYADTSYAHAFLYSKASGMTDLGVLPGDNGSEATAINASGYVVGWSSFSPANPPVTSRRAFLKKPGSAMMSLGVISGNKFSGALGINSAGTIVGECDNGSEDTGHAFIYTAASGMKSLPTLGGAYSWAEGINDSGQVVGWASTSNGDRHAFLYTPGKGMTDLGTLGGKGSDALAINSSGQVVGGAQLSNGLWHAFLYTPGKGMMDLGVIGSDTTSNACAINDSGVVLGWSEPNESDTSGHTFIYSSASGIVDLATLVPASADISFQITGNAGLNNSGQIAFMNFLLTPPANIPMPPANHAPVLDNTGSMALMAINEDAASNGGTLISAIIASAGGNRITDADSGAKEGIAVVAANTTNGTWQYTTNGTTWTTFTASATSARLLASDASTKIRFVPKASYNGTLASAITFRAWDQTSGSNGGTASVSTNGGSTAFSTATETASLVVNPVNDAPALDTSVGMAIGNVVVGRANTGTRILDLIGSAGGNRITDVDTTALEGIAIVGTNNTNGSWQFSTNGGSSWTTFNGYYSTARLLASDANTCVRFVPKAGFSGTVTGALTFKAWDQSTGTNGSAINGSTCGGSSSLSLATESINITVFPGNHAPVLDSTGNTSLTKVVVGGANAGTKVSDLIASAGGDRITDVDANAKEGIAIVATDTTHGSWQYSLDGKSWTTFKGYYTSARLLSADAYIRFVPTAGYTGTVTGGITFRAWDQSDGVNGGTINSLTNGGNSSLSTTLETANVIVSLT